MDQFLIAVLSFFGAEIISRFISEAAFKTLAAEQKVALLDTMTPLQKYGLVIFLVVIVVAWRHPRVLAAGVLIYLLTKHVLSFIKVKRLDLPSQYIRSYVISLLISLVGIGIFFYLPWDGGVFA